MPLRLSGVGNSRSEARVQFCTFQLRRSSDQGNSQGWLQSTYADPGTGVLKTSMTRAFRLFFEPKLQLQFTCKPAETKSRLIQRYGFMLRSSLTYKHGFGMCTFACT